MDITVVLCTYNRSRSLPQALESVLASTIPLDTTWEVLVVDNNSTDQTRQLIEEFCQRHPDRVRYLFEPQQGLSVARNAGIRQSHGAVVAFMDDDVTVAPTWLLALTTSVLLQNDKWAGAGGRVLPQWTSPPPAWLPLNDRYALAPLAMFDPHLEAGPLDEPPFGANMAFRREMFKKYGTFRTDLGRCGANMLSNEDTEFGQRLLDAGEKLRFEPSAVVHHPVPPSRVQKTYFLAWWFAKARSDVRQNGIPADTRWFVAGVPLYLFRRLVVWTTRWLVTLNPSRRFSCKLKLWGVAGAIQECYCNSIGAVKRAAKVTSKTA